MRTKLEHVKELLAQNNLSIGEISEKCGFARESHLAVLFKKATGVLMRDWRQQNRDTGDD